MNDRYFWNKLTHLVYSTWSEYSSCTKTCGGGEELRTRECVDGTCSLATQDDVSQTQSCNAEACPPGK